MSSLFDPGRNALFLGCGRFDAAREEAEEGAGEGRPPCGGIKPPGCRGESAMTSRVAIIECTTEFRQVYGRPVLVLSASDADTLNDDAAVDKRGRGVGDC